jgi:hypothetical protein
METEDFVMVGKMFGLFMLAGLAFGLFMLAADATIFSYDKWRCASVGGSFEVHCLDDHPCNRYGCRTGK